MVSPLLFSVFAIPVFKCNWLELLVFWLPMFFFQDMCIRLNSGNAMSTKWSGIYETSVMPHLFLPVLKESVGISLSKFKVTDKNKKSGKRQRDVKSMLPFIVIMVLSVVGIIRLIVTFDVTQVVSTLILIFWIIRNLYFLTMALFLVDGRDSDGDDVKVYDGHIAEVKTKDKAYDGVTTLLTEHNLTVFLDESEDLSIGTEVTATVTKGDLTVSVKGVVTGIRESRGGRVRTHTIEILDFGTEELEWLQILFDRIPTLPQSLQRDFGVFTLLWQNIAYRVARTTRT